MKRKLYLCSYPIKNKFNQNNSLIENKIAINDILH